MFSWRSTRSSGLLVALAVLLGASAIDAAPTNVRLDVHEFRIVERESGPTNYYSVVDDPVEPFIRAEYRPGFETAVFGVRLPDSTRRATHLHWDWRARTLPRDPGMCNAKSGLADTAALIYAIWKRGLRWYTIRYVWSANAPRGNVCNGKRNLFLAEDTVVLETGDGNGSWVSEDLDLPAEFRRHFSNGDPRADVPDFIGIGLMTDGDQARSESAADYADFLVRN
jgi:hypothetical protein